MEKQTKDPPLAQLVRRIREAKYQPTKEEIQTLISCKQEIIFRGAEGALFAFVGAMASIKGKLPSRILCSSVAAYGASRVTQWFAYRTCIRKVLELENSSMAEELVHILSKDFPNNPALKAYHQKRQSTYSIFTADESGATGPKRLPAVVSVLASDREDGTIEGPPFFERDQNVITSERLKQRLVERQEEKAEARVEDVLLEDSMADPMSFAFNGAEYYEDYDGDKSKVEIRRSRMSPTERREFNRKQFLEWQKNQHQKQKMKSSSEVRAKERDSSPSSSADKWASNVTKKSLVPPENFQYSSSFLLQWQGLSRKMTQEHLFP